MGVVLTSICLRPRMLAALGLGTVAFYAVVVSVRPNSQSSKCPMSARGKGSVYDAN